MSTRTYALPVLSMLGTHESRATLPGPNIRAHELRARPQNSRRRSRRRSLSLNVAIRQCRGRWASHGGGAGVGMRGTGCGLAGCHCARCFCFLNIRMLSCSPRFLSAANSTLEADSMSNQTPLPASLRGMATPSSPSGLRFRYKAKWCI